MEYEYASHRWAGLPECKRKNYGTTKNKQKTTDKLEKKKFCRACRKHTVHREGK